MPAPISNTQNRVENEHGLHESSEIQIVREAQKNNLFNLHNHPQRGLVEELGRKRPIRGFRRLGRLIKLTVGNRPARGLVNEKGLTNVMSASPFDSSDAFASVIVSVNYFAEFPSVG